MKPMNNKAYWSYLFGIAGGACIPVFVDLFMRGFLGFASGVAAGGLIMLAFGWFSGIED